MGLARPDTLPKAGRPARRDSEHVRNGTPNLFASLEIQSGEVAAMASKTRDRWDLIAFYRFPSSHWSKLRSTNPLERVNREVGRRSDVVGIFPNDASAIRLAGALLIEQCDEWLVARRYLSEESLALVLEDQGDEEREEVPALQAA